MADRTSAATTSTATRTDGADAMDALARLSELFSDRPVGELAIVLDRHGGDVKAAAWALLNGKRVEEEGVLPQDQQPQPRNNYFYDGHSGGGDESENDDDDDNGENQNLLVNWDVVESPIRSAPEEIQRLYEEGTINQQEYDTMIAADRRAAEHRESRQHSAMNGGDVDGGDGEDEVRSSSGQRTFKATKHLKALTDRLQKINLNLPALIDQMERDQEVADQLDSINREFAEESERKKMVREAERQSLEIMHEHLEEFLRENPRATYESWIAALHPDNVVEGKLLEGVSGSTEIDHRFFVADSDHRKLWNESISDRNDGDRRGYVPARTSKAAEGQGGENVIEKVVVRDLLGSGSIIKTASVAAPPRADDTNGSEINDDVNLLNMHSLREEEDTC
mmetsp:Transcript_16172/g.46450  ORF Transcript_16172/g.46450 Transcript_16172/m.46450 type:complete len:395 (+) Transcript_16172:69-1253(+)